MWPGSPPVKKIHLHQVPGHRPGVRIFLEVRDQRHSHRPHFHRRTPLRDASLSTHLNHGPAQDRLAPHPLVRLGQRVVDLAVLGTADDPAVASVRDRDFITS